MRDMGDLVISKENLLFAVQVVCYFVIPAIFVWLGKNSKDNSKLNQTLAEQKVTLDLEVKRLEATDSDLARRLDHIDSRLDDIGRDVKELLKRG